VLGLSSLGDWLGLLATSTFAADQVSGSAAKGAAFGGVIAVRMLPALVLGPVSGVIADRWDRRYTMVVCDLVRFVLFASIPTVALLTTDTASSSAWARGGHVHHRDRADGVGPGQGVPASPTCCPGPAWKRPTS